ncbi:MAG: hypothetical protein KDB96_04875 [Flavobacteriales bacterium]|nr:hypothetical protein [Flavobacteriales bacterium]
MNRRLIRSIFVLLVLAAAAWWLQDRDTGSTLDRPLTDFSVADTSQVSRIFIAETNGRSVDLRRSAEGHWTVLGAWREKDGTVHQAGPFRARRSLVDLALKTFLRVEVRAPVARSAEANVFKKMSAMGRKVEIYEGSDEPSRVWYVGSATPDQKGTYMLLEKPGLGKSSQAFIMGMSGFTGHLSSRFLAMLDDWRSSQVFSYPDVGEVASVEVQHPYDREASFRVAQSSGGELALFDANGRPVPVFDTLAVQDLILQFQDLHFEGFERKLSDTGRDSIMHSLPARIVRVTDRDGEVNEVPFFAKAPYPGETNLEGDLIDRDLDRMYAVVQDTSLVLVQRHLFDRIVPAIDDLR